jgi:hypothetical protein
LKSVYSGAGDCYQAREAGISCGVWAMACVNMFLRQKLGEKMVVAEGVVKNYSLIDISETWTPSEQDFLAAVAEIEKHDLNYDFKSVDDIYIEPYERLEIEW